MMGIDIFQREQKLRTKSNVNEEKINELKPLVTDCISSCSLLPSNDSNWERLDPARNRVWMIYVILKYEKK